MDSISFKVDFLLKNGKILQKFITKKLAVELLKIGESLPCGIIAQVKKHFIPSFKFVFIDGQVFTGRFKTVFQWSNYVGEFNCQIPLHFSVDISPSDETTDVIEVLFYNLVEVSPIENN